MKIIKHGTVIPNDDGNCTYKDFVFDCEGGPIDQGEIARLVAESLADSAALGALRAKLAALCERWEECATRPLTESDYQNPAVTSTIRQICDECARELREAMGE